MTATMTDDEFGEFVLAAWPGLYRTAYLMLGDHQLAEDLVQTSLAKTYASWRRIDDRSAAPAYARVVLANTAASWFRRKGWRNEHPTEVLPDPGVDHDFTTRTAVVDALATLAPRQRAVVVLRYYDDLSVREVAHALGISEGTVKSQTSDALARLRDVLDDEAASVHVPAADPDAVVGQGRRIRRDRRIRVAAAVTAVVAILAVALASVVGPGRDRAEKVPPAGGPHDTGWAVASGSTVQLGTGRTIEFDSTVGYLFYTSAGVLVSYGPSAGLRVLGPKFALVDSTGVINEFTLDTGDQLPSTDPTQPYLTYVRATARTDQWQIVLRDVRTGRDVRKVPVTGTFDYSDDGGVPDPRLDGQHVYVSFDQATVDVDLQTGRATPVDALPVQTSPFVSGGREAINTGFPPDTEHTIVDVSSGKVLLRKQDDNSWFGLARDGHHALATPSMECGNDPFDCAWVSPTAVVYDLDRGSKVQFDIEHASLGWTTGGNLLRITQDAVEVCDPDTGACSSTDLDLDPRRLLVGGEGYESAIP